jgi:hypothetical protein
MITPPNGTKIRIESNRSDQQEIIIPQPRRGIFRYFIGAFIILWLGGWVSGWHSAAAELLKGTKGPHMFLIFWLAAWTIGGVLAVYYLYRIFRPSLPERIILSYPNMIYDSGIPPFRVIFSFGSQKDVWKTMFPKRVKTEFDLSDLKTLTLREHDSGNRLTIDQGNNRYNLAEGASEPEREWLFKVLNDKYNS